MATTTNITTTYAGEKAAPYVSAALLSATTIENGGITVRPNVKYKQVLKKVAMSGLVADGSCDFTPTGTVDITENILEPQEFQVNYTLCKKDFRSDWDAISMGYSAHDNLPPDFASYIIAKTAAEIATYNERVIWQGQAANAGEYAGYIELAEADADVIPVTGSAITSANVVSELGAIVDAIPATLYGSPELRIFVPQNVWRAYVRSLGGYAANGQGANGFEGRGNNQGYQDLMFDGVRLFVANGLPNDVCFAAEVSNLHFGTGLMSDHNEVKLLDMADLDGSQNCRFVMRYTAAVNYVFGSEIVYRKNA